MEMRAIRLIAFATSYFLASNGWTNDVDYKLNTDTLNHAEIKVSLAISPIVISDRVWAAPGVEQTTKDLLPPVKFDFAAPQRPRIVAAEDCRDFATMMRYPRVGPEWLDDVALPLTRELYGLGRPYDDGDDRTEFTFGGITLQR